MKKHIINSLLDTDLYKITMLRTYFYRFSNCTGRFEFMCRNSDVIFTQSMLVRINNELDHLCSLRFTEEEINRIANLRFMKNAIGFFEFLRMFKLNRNCITTNLTDGKLSVTANGPIFQSSYFETFVLSIVNEVYFNETYPEIDLSEGNRILHDIINKIRKYTDDLNEFKFSEFGTRRRFSFHRQEHVILELTKEFDNSIFTGTSNMYFAFKLNLTAIGTMAHEYLGLGQALPNVSLKYSQQYMLEQWSQEYNGDLGYALTDNLTSKKFFEDFGLRLAKEYDGLRHDSGCPYKWTDDVINFYKKNRIDPKTKTLVYSNGLHIEDAIKINEYRKGEVNKNFGIGTSLTNNVGVKSLNIVMKLVEANGLPVIKISDDEGKLMTGHMDDTYYEYIKSVIG